MKKNILLAVILISIGITGCDTQTDSLPKNKEVEIEVDEQTSELKSHIALFEIPVTDISRAVDFYQGILDINIEKMEMPGMEMGIFPHEGQMVTGVLMKSEGYTPTAAGVTIYLNGGENLQTILDKIEPLGGIIIVPKTPHADESGFFALFLDSEGNKIGLNSPK